jgi:hypothetical protein
MPSYIISIKKVETSTCRVEADDRYDAYMKVKKLEGLSGHNIIENVTYEYGPPNPTTVVLSNKTGTSPQFICSKIGDQDVVLVNNGDRPSGILNWNDLPPQLSSYQF